ncbi:hypothetical protein BJX70DRAFT_399137 [Aspergillus crustosus]
MTSLDRSSQDSTTKQTLTCPFCPLLGHKRIPEFDLHTTSPPSGFETLEMNKWTKCPQCGLMIDVSSHTHTPTPTPTPTSTYTPSSSSTSTYTPAPNPTSTPIPKHEEQTLASAITNIITTETDYLSEEYRDRDDDIVVEYVLRDAAEKVRRDYEALRRAWGLESGGGVWDWIQGLCRRVGFD